MRAFSVVPPAAAVSVFSLLGIPERDARCDSIGLQSLAANVAIINFGTSVLQIGEIAVGASTILPMRDAKNVFVSGNAADILAVFLFE